MRTYLLIIVFFLLAILPHQSQAQTPNGTPRANISGIILDAKNGEPLTGVNVVLSRQADTSQQIDENLIDEKIKKKSKKVIPLNNISYFCIS